MIIRFADCPSQPWKNGLGRTREIAVQPSGAGMDDFQWRVSIAEVDSGAPFSSFPGIDRSIALLDGNGFTMMLDGNCTHALTTPFTPFVFGGEAHVEVDLVDGATRDFNLMIRRARASGEVLVWREGSHLLDSAIALIHVARGQIDMVAGTLHVGDSWLVGESAEVERIQLHDDTIAFAIRIVHKT